MRQQWAASPDLPVYAFAPVRFPPLRLRLSTIFSFVVILLTVGMFESFLINEDLGTGGGIVGLQIAWGALYLIALGWTVFNLRNVTALLFRSKFYLLAPLLALASVGWAQHPGPTLRRSLALFFTYLLGAFIALRCDRQLQLKLLSTILLLSAVLSYAVELLAPGWVPVVEEHPGSWNGVFPHKNMLAKVMVLLITALLCTTPANNRERLQKWGGMVAAWGLLLLSRAASGILVMVVLVGCYLVVRQLRRGVQTLILFLISATALVAIGSLFADGLEDKLLHLLGKSSDLSGRTTIWAVSLLSIAKRPLLGYGFHGFWRENAEALTARAFIPNHWDAPHAHNGYIETLLELGIVGLVIVMGGFLLLLARGFRRYQATGDRADLWPVMLALMFFFYNISEAMGMAENTIGWILFTAAFFTAAAEQTPALVPWSAE